MIIEYHRPETLEEALKLLARKTPETRPLGGGTVLNAPAAGRVAAVDLQALGLSAIKSKGKTLHIGATTTLQSLMEAEGIPPALAAAIRHEAALTIRQTATVAGALVSAGGRSPFATAMLALDASLLLQPGDEEAGYGDLLALRAGMLKGRLITEVRIPTQASLLYEYVARSPADLPVVCIAMASWPGGRTRLAAGGWGAAPVLALDGKDASGIVEGLESVLEGASDQWATAEYRVEAGRALARRGMAAVQP